MKTILVLGGAGYIGSHTVYELIDNGYDVVVADNLETGFRKAVHPKARFYQGDIRSKEFCDHVFSSEKIDAVIHFAANSHVGESMVNPLKYYDNNLGGLSSETSKSPNACAEISSGLPSVQVPVLSRTTDRKSVV